MALLQWDNKISTGHVLTFAVLAAGVLSGWNNLNSRQSQIEVEIYRLIQASQEREARIRVVELTQAAQTSDIRSIQNGVNRIETKLDQLAEKAE